MRVRMPVLTALFDAMPSGVVMMNRDSEVLFYNRYEEQLAGRQREAVLGKRFFEQVAPCTLVTGLGDYFHEQVETGELYRTLDFRFPKPFLDRPRDVRLVLTSMSHDDERFGVLFVEDVSRIRAIERTKDFLVRMLAHDMNSPLTAAMSSVSMMEQELGETPWPATTMRSLERLRDMVINLYEITELHTSDVPLTQKVVDASRLAHEAADGTAAIAKSRGVRVRVSTPPAIEAELDPELVRRAIINLLDNAIRYADEGGEVSVNVAQVGDDLSIEIADDGPGVPEPLREKIFRPFVKGGDGFVESPAHHGLGLAFVDLVAREHGGRVQLHCPAEGGAVFTLELPRSGRRLEACADRRR